MILHLKTLIHAPFLTSISAYFLYHYMHKLHLGCVTFILVIFKIQDCFVHNSSVLAHFHSSQVVPLFFALAIDSRPYPSTVPLWVLEISLGVEATRIIFLLSLSYPLYDLLPHHPFRNFLKLFFVIPFAHRSQRKIHLCVFLSSYNLESYGYLSLYT